MTQHQSPSPTNAGWSAAVVICVWVFVVAVPLWVLDPLFAGVLQRDRQIAIQEAARNLVDEMDDFRRDLGFKAYARRITDRLVADMHTDLARRQTPKAPNTFDPPGSTRWCRRWHDTLERELGQPLLAGYITDIDTGAEFRWATPEFTALETPTVTLASLSVRHAELQRLRRTIPVLTPVATACPPFVEAPATEYEVGQMAEVLFGPTAGINRSKPQLDSIYAPAIRDMIYVWHGVVDGPTAGEAGRINCVAVFRDQDVSPQRMLEVACRLTARRGCRRLFLPEYSVNHPTLHEDPQGLLYLDAAPVDWLVSRPSAGLTPEWQRLRARTCAGHVPSIGIRIDNTYIIHTLAAWVTSMRAGLGTLALGVLVVLLWSRRGTGRHRPHTVRGYIGLALAAAVARIGQLAA